MSLNGDVYTAYTLENKGIFKAYLKKTDKHGNELWKNSFFSSDEQIYLDFKKSNDKGFLLSRRFRGGFSILKLDKEGNL